MFTGVGVMLVAALWCCMWGRGPIGSHGTCSTLCRFSVTSSTTHNQIGLFWCCFLSAWVCVGSRALWVSPMNSPVRLRVSPAAASIPTGVSSQRFEALFPHAGTLSCEVCGWVYQLLPHCQLQLCPPRSTICHLPRSASLRLAVSPLLPAACLCPSYRSGWLFLLYLLGCWTSIQFDFLSVLVVFCL